MVDQIPNALLGNVELPKDKSGDSIPLLARDDTEVDSFNFTDATGTTARPMPASTDIVEVTVTEDCHIAFGGSGITATTSSGIILRGTYTYRINRNTQTHYAIRRVRLTEPLH